MRRSPLALGASVLALALMAGPAAADPGPGQTVDSSAGVAQVGAVTVDAPVRVASDGNSPAAGVSAGGPQTTSESAGAAQVGPVDANAPVRVLSDGDDAEPAKSQAAGGGEQATSESVGSAQVGAVDANAPVRVASDGNSSAAGGSAGGPQSTSDSAGAAQVAPPSVSAPVRAFSPEPGDQESGGEVVVDLLDGLLGNPLGGAGGGPPVASPSEVAETAPGERSSPSRDELRRLIDGADPDPAVRFVSDGGAIESGGAEFATLGVSAASSLPYTGSHPAVLIALGIGLLSTGALASRLVQPSTRR
jgi:hypothetical protein